MCNAQGCEGPGVMHARMIEKIEDVLYKAPPSVLKTIIEKLHPLREFTEIDMYELRERVMRLAGNSAYNAGMILKILER